MIAERLHHRPLTTGHLLIALAESRDEHASELAKTLPDLSAVNAAVAESFDR